MDPLGAGDSPSSGPCCGAPCGSGRREGGRPRGRRGGWLGTSAGLEKGAASGGRVRLVVLRRSDRHLLAHPALQARAHSLETQDSNSVANR